MNLSTKLAYNTIAQIISKVVATILGLLTVAIITRYLGDTGYGQYTTIITFLSFFGIIADMGLTLVTVQMISQPKADEEKILGNLFSLRLLSAVLFIGLAPLIIWFFPYNETIKLGAAITAASFLFTALNQIFVGFFQKHLRMDKVSIAEVVGRIVLLIGAYLSFNNGYGLNGILYSTVISSLINFLWLYASAQKITKFKIRFDKDIWLKTLGLAWPLAITISLNLIYLRSDALLLSLIPRDTSVGIIAEVGLYGAAYKIIDVLITVPFMFSGLILPFLTLAWAQKNKQEFNKLCAKSFELLFLIAIPFVVGAQIISKELMVFVAGSEFQDSGQILRLLILASLFIFVGNIFAHAIIALNKQKKIIGAYIFTALSSLFLYLILIPKFSYLGAAWVTIYSEAVIALASILLVQKYTNFKFHFLPIIKFTLAALVMGIVLYFGKGYWNDSVLISLLAAGITYPLSLLLFRAISKNDINILFNKTNDTKPKA